eukprot:1130933-Pleurochrysis_carterae.AAC.1
MLDVSVEALPECARVPPRPALKIEFAFALKRKIPRARMKSARGPVERATRPQRWGTGRAAPWRPAAIGGKPARYNRTEGRLTA